MYGTVIEWVVECRWAAVPCEQLWRGRWGCPWFYRVVIHAKVIKDLSDLVESDVSIHHPCIRCWRLRSRRGHPILWLPVGPCSSSLRLPCRSRLYRDRPKDCHPCREHTVSFLGRRHIRQPWTAWIPGHWSVYRREICSIHARPVSVHICSDESWEHSLLDHCHLRAPLQMVFSCTVSSPLGPARTLGRSQFVLCAIQFRF